jgi:hypothetical protein
MRKLKINNKKNQEQLTNNSKKQTKITKSHMMKSQSMIKQTWTKYLTLRRKQTTRIKAPHKWIMPELMLKKLSMKMRKMENKMAKSNQ